jgi:hypothetical protein
MRMGLIGVSEDFFDNFNNIRITTFPKLVLGASGLVNRASSDRRMISCMIIEYFPTIPLYPQMKGNSVVHKLIDAHEKLL